MIEKINKFDSILTKNSLPFPREASRLSCHSSFSLDAACLLYNWQTSPHPGLNDHIYTIIWDWLSPFFSSFRDEVHNSQATMFDVDGTSNNWQTSKDSGLQDCRYAFLLYRHAAYCGKHGLEPYINGLIIFASRTCVGRTFKDNAHWRRWHKRQAALTSKATCCGTSHATRVSRGAAIHRIRTESLSSCWFTASCWLL
jgi:hypothetical protein